MIEQKNWKIMKIIFSTIFCLTSHPKRESGKKISYNIFFNILKKWKWKMKATKKKFLYSFENEDYFIVTQTLLLFKKRYKDKNSFLFFISVLNSIII